MSQNILIGVTGSISAYKSALIVRLLVKKGFNVQVVMTASAKSFVTPLTLSTVSKKPVFENLFDPDTGEWVNHVHLGEWADAFLVAPASANTIAKMANGISDNLLLTTYLSAKCPVVVAPAMDHDMWHHKATQRNVEILRMDGIHIIEPEHGELASGIIGDGRLPEPENVVDSLVNILDNS